MLRDFLPLIAALMVAAGIYIARERHRRRTTINPARPDLTMAEAWQLWLDSGERTPAKQVEEQAVPSLLETERVLGRSDHPLRQLRSEILRDATTSLYLELILELNDTERSVLLKGYTPEMEPALRGALELSTIRWSVLREYGALKYDDAATDDWFDQYTRIARPYIREKLRLARDHLLEFDEGARRLAEIYDALLADLADNMLKSPRKKRFVPPDLEGRG